MYVFVVLVMNQTAAGFNIEVAGVHRHLTDAMQSARALRGGSALGITTRVIRKTLQGGKPSDEVAVGGTPGQGLTIPMRVGPPVPASRRLTEPESEADIAERLRARKASGAL